MDTESRNAKTPTRDERALWYGLAAAGVAATAVAGGMAVDPRSSWYRSLRKPSWQPPPWAFGAVWTPLYATLAYASGHALGITEGTRRRRLLASVACNLALNAGWNWLFFRLRSPRAGLVGCALLDLSNAELIRRTARVDATTAYTLLPYAAWSAFATGLNAAIVRRNP
ncbi:TspO/MBR family protein [Streptomyces venezuelae ATCC 10712]